MSVKIPSGIKYAWKNNIILSKEGIARFVDPQEVSERIEEIRASQGGSITPHDLVVDGENPESVLSQCFKNTEKEDAHSWRLQIARSILGNLTTISLDKDGSEVLGMHLLSVRDKDGSRFYTDIVTIAEDVDLTKSVVAEAKAKLNAWEKRYEDITELTHYLKAIKDARKKDES